MSRKSEASLTVIERVCYGAECIGLVLLVLFCSWGKKDEWRMGRGKMLSTKEFEGGFLLLLWWVVGVKIGGDGRISGGGLRVLSVYYVVCVSGWGSVCMYECECELVCVQVNENEWKWMRKWTKSTECNVKSEGRRKEKRSKMCEIEKKGKEERKKRKRRKRKRRGCMPLRIKINKKYVQGRSKSTGVVWKEGIVVYEHKNVV